jgi:hypothetical protein
MSPVTVNVPCEGSGGWDTSGCAGTSVAPRKSRS